MHEEAQAWSKWARGLGDRARLHGDVRLLRRHRRSRGPGDDPPRARSRLQLPGHLRHVRAAHQRGLVGRAIAGRRDEVFLATKFGIKLEPRRRLAAASTAARSTCARPARPRCSASASTTSTSTTSTVSIRTPRSRRRSARWPSSSPRARCATSASPRPAPRRSAAPTPCTRSRRCRASTRCGRAISRRTSWPRCESSGSGSSPTRRSGAGSSPGASPRPRSSTRVTSAATARASPARTSSTTSQLAERVKELAGERGITPGQLALAWVLRQRRAHRADPRHQAPSHTWKRTSPPPTIELSDAEVRRIAQSVMPAAGERYDEEGMRTINI